MGQLLRMRADEWNGNEDALSDDGDWRLEGAFEMAECAASRAISRRSVSAMRDKAFGDTLGECTQDSR